jgi:hypothetical protein
MGLHCFALLHLAWQGGRCIRLETGFKTHSKDSIAKAPNPTDNTESTSKKNATEPCEHVSCHSLKIIETRFEEQAQEAEHLKNQREKNCIDTLRKFVNNMSEWGPVTDAPKAKIKIDTFSKLGFVHRRNVFEPPEPKVDYPYYVFGKN